MPTTAGTGPTALDATGRLNPNLVLMDIKLRGNMDGIETAAAIQARFDIPIVYLTSHSDETTLSRAKATNPYGYLLKPFSDRELRTAIEVALHRHALESRIALRERWFSTTLRSIGDAVIATDPDQTITFLNVVAERLTGWGQEAVGRPITEVFHVVDNLGVPIPSPIGLAIQRSAAVELPPNTGLVVRTGARIAVDDSASPIIDDKGTVLGGVVVFRDITERRQLEARVAQTERLASLGTMAAGVAHEINNPLTYVIANIELSLEDLQRVVETIGLAPEFAHSERGELVVEQLASMHSALSDAGDGAERVRGIVQDLRKFALGDGTPNAAVDLAAVLEVAIKMTAHIVSHHARVRIELGPAPLVAGSGGAIGQVFTNLLLNAAQAISEGHAEENEIVVTTSTDAAGRAVVEVRDTGAGIPVHVLPRIFDPFFTTKRVGEGMGLGLAICHNIVTELGGSLVAESAAGGGALFRLTLPFAREPAVASRAEAPASALARRARVLVIDDEAAIAKAIARTLGREHDVTVEADGRASVALVAAGAEYDVIFCDVMMPNMSGVEVYEALYALNVQQASRVIFITGGATSTSTQEFLAGLPNRQLRKPFTAEAIRAIVSERSM